MDIQLNYIERGRGVPLILLHGNGESSDYFTRQMDFFAPEYRVIAIDTRGHGRSPRGAGPFTLGQFAEDLKALMDTLELPDAHILGFSDGGNIALLFALRYPERVRTLILNGANLNPGGVKALVQLPVCLGYGAAFLLSRFSPRARHKKELLGLMVHEPNIRPEELKKLTMPVLVIAGTKDMIRNSHTRLIASSIPNSELCLLYGDHFIAKKQSDPFNERVWAFLDQPR